MRVEEERGVEEGREGKRRINGGVPLELGIGLFVIKL